MLQSPRQTLHSQHSVLKNHQTARHLSSQAELSPFRPVFVFEKYPRLFFRPPGATIHGNLLPGFPRPASHRGQVSLLPHDSCKESSTMSHPHAEPLLLLPPVKITSVCKNRRCARLTIFCIGSASGTVSCESPKHCDLKSAPSLTPSRKRTFLAALHDLILSHGDDAIPMKRVYHVGHRLCRRDNSRSPRHGAPHYLLQQSDPIKERRVGAQNLVVGAKTRSGLRE